MKIKSLHIENFGKLSNFDIDFNENLTQFCRQNGWGKSTLSHFLKAMFYSMPKKGNLKPYAAERSKFKPWQGGIYGGSLTFCVKEKTYRVTRTFADTPENDTFELIDLDTGLKSKDYSKDLGRELFGVGVETFEITAFFPQMAFESGLTDEMRANMTGLNKFENDLSSLSTAQKKIASRLKDLKGLKPKPAELDAKKKSILDGKRLISTYENEKEKFEKNILNLKGSIEKQSKTVSKLKEKREEVSSQRKEKEKKEQQLYALQEQLTLALATKTEEEPRIEKKKSFGIFAYLLPVLTLLSAGAFFALGWFRVLSMTAGLIVAVIILIIGAAGEYILLSNRKPKKEAAPVKKEDGQLATNLAALRIGFNAIKDELASTECATFNEEEFEKESSILAEMKTELAVLNQKLISKSRELEESYDRQEILEKEYDEMLQRKDQTSQKEMILIKTKEFLDKAKENVSTRFSKPYKEAFNKVFEAVAGDKNGKISIDLNLKVTENSPSGEKEFEYLSQGYRDAISICQRFALLETIYKKEKPFVLLDDPFVNLDEEKVSVMSKIVNDFAKSYQTIYLYCHERNEIK